MKSFVIAAALAVTSLGALALPAVAAELTGGCSLALSSADAQGTPLDAGGVPPGTTGTADAPFRASWAGTVDFQFSTGATPFQEDLRATVYALGLPFPIFRTTDPGPMDPAATGRIHVGGDTPGLIVGTFYVSGFLEGNGGSSRCDGSGWVRLVGDPLGTIPFWAGIVSLLLGAALLAVTPYTRRREAVASQMPPDEFDPVAAPVVTPMDPAAYPTAPVAVRVTKHRHWLRGVVGGFLFGVGLAVLSIVLGFNALGPATPWVLLLVGIVLGVVLVFVPSPRRERPRRAEPPDGAEPSPV